MGKEVKINPAFLKEVESKIMKYIDASEEVTSQLLLIEGVINESFSGPAADAMKAYLTNLRTKMTHEFGEFIQKNYDKVSILRKSFKEVDSNLSGQFAFGTSKTQVVTGETKYSEVGVPERNHSGQPSTKSEKYYTRK